MSDSPSMENANRPPLDYCSEGAYAEKKQEPEPWYTHPPFDCFNVFHMTHYDGAPGRNQFCPDCGGTWKHFELPELRRLRGSLGDRLQRPEVLDLYPEVE